MRKLFVILFCVCVMLILTGCNITNNTSATEGLAEPTEPQTTVTIRKPYVVNFMVDGKKYDSVGCDSKDTISMPIEPRKYGYRFAGWYYTTTYERQFYSDSLITRPTSQDFDVYAKWELVEYDVEYYLNGGTNSIINVSQYSVEDINEEKKFVLAAPTKIVNFSEGATTSLSNGKFEISGESTYYEFEGWYREETFVNRVEYLSYGENDVKLYAKWNDEPTTKHNTFQEQMYIRKDDYIYYGMYPQTNVTSTTITKKLKEIVGTSPTETEPNNWISYGYYDLREVNDYMWYQDVVYKGETYRGVYFSYYRPISTLFSKTETPMYNDYSKDTIYWFKFEPVKWKILEEKDGTAKLLCEMIIDSQAFQNTLKYNRENKLYYNGNEGTPEGIYSNNWEYSTIRKWLNEDFYNTAFNTLQKEIIISQELDNKTTGDGGSSNRYNACQNNTNDNVYLPSFVDAQNLDYWFVSGYTIQDCRTKIVTEYALIQGTGTGVWKYGENGYWILRSAGRDGSDDISAISYYGGMSTTQTSVTYYGIVPMITIKL